MNSKLYFCFFLIVSMCTAAPKRHKEISGTTFDQKQSGEYNIQLHLKDFQIIAVVGDDSFSSFGDYDYNYDYAELTVKPPSTTSTSTTTIKPQETTTAINPIDISTLVSSTPKPTTMKKQSYTHPYPIISPSTTRKTTEAPTLSPSTTKQPHEEQPIVSSTTIIPDFTTFSQKENSNPVKNDSVPLPLTSLTTKGPQPTTSTPSTTLAIVSNEKPTIPTTSSTPKTTSTTKFPQEIQNQHVPGQIPVVVQDFVVLRDVKDKDNKKVEGITSVTIVPLDDSPSGIDSGDQLTLGEIMHYRRCAQGYQRDKRGRCRKVRRPQIPLGITRFASNLAARFRQPGAGNAENLDEINIE